MTSLLAELVESTDIDRLISRRLLEATPEIFIGDRDAYVEWKSKLAVELDVEPYMILMVGSAALGFSMNPGKDFSTFQDSSDIDVAVVSTHYFDTCWRYLRNLGAERYRMPRRVQHHIRDHAKSYVYWGTIATDRILAYLPFGPAWTRGLARMARVAPTMGREINVRLYRDVDSLRAYQVRGFKAAQTRLLSQ